MEFRTQIDIPNKPGITIAHNEPIVMLGSCFTDNVGERLAFDGFDVIHNPMGTLYNPVSILSAVKLALEPESQRDLIIRADDAGVHHCLNFASRYAADTRDRVEDMVNTDLDNLGSNLRRAKTAIFTLGTAYVFDINDTAQTVGNCHKFHPGIFTRRRLSVAEITESLLTLTHLLDGVKVIFTVSPIRHTADGLHGNQISKASLLLALDSVVDGDKAHYFPAYEIVLDDLRDYRFYAADMKHPSPVAVEYIYEVFAKYYFTPQTSALASAARRQNQRLAHRPMS